ncbi:hypothetical protein DBR40_25200, partial [Pedobacter sp. KBW01]|uniref:ComEC/Rec2 family competence protein n=1 Tax=Pedobacter sp. KBW01 TaxID=2153364 RepID=UPI000F969F71
FGGSANLGLFYNYTFKNMYWYNEVGKALNGGVVAISGVLISLSSSVSAAVTYRNYSKNQGVPESTEAVNERVFFSAFCQLIYNPFSIWDVGFQLSYLAVFGLFYLQPKIYNLFYIENKWLDKLWNFIAMSLAAQIATFSLSIYYFHQFPLYFLIGNLFITLPLVLMMYLEVAVLIPGLSFWLLLSNG